MFLKDVFRAIFRARHGVVISAEIIYLLNLHVTIQYKSRLKAKLKFNIDGKDVISELLSIYVLGRDVYKYKPYQIIMIKVDPQNVNNLVVLSTLQDATRKNL